MAPTPSRASTDGVRSLGPADHALLALPELRNPTKPLSPLLREPQSTSTAAGHAGQAAGLCLLGPGAPRVEDLGDVGEAVGGGYAGEEQGSVAAA
jgi:hypothetical protein